MQNILLPVATLLISLAAPAWSAELALNLTNMSGEEITAATATPKGITEASTRNLFVSAIPAGEASSAMLQVADGECVFDLHFTFASGKTLARPDTDLCQTDGIVVE